MRFIFSVVTNLTYTFLCVSIQYLILYFYRLLFFPSLYLLSISLVVIELYSSIIIYALSILLLANYDADTFRSQNDILIESNNSNSDLALLDSSSDSNSSEDKASDKAHGGKDVANASPESNTIFRSSHVDTLIVLLLCHSTVFLSAFVIFAIALYECLYVHQSTICRMTFGFHSANHAVGISILLLNFSVLMPLLSLYKLNVGTSPIFHNHMPTLVIMLICFMHATFISKMQFYSVSCPLLVSFQGSPLLVYSTVALHFLFRCIDNSIVFCSRHSPHHRHPPSARIPTSHDNVFSSLFVLIANTVLLLGNLAYTWSLSTSFNLVQSVVIFCFIIAMSHRIIKLPTIRYQKKVN